MNWLCSINVRAPCADFPTTVGSAVLFMLSIALACYLLWLLGRLIWIAHTFNYWRWRDDAHKDAERLLEVHLKHGHGGAGLYTDLPSNFAPAPAPEDLARLNRRVTVEMRRIDQLERDVKKLGDPDHGLDSEAVPCTRGKSGRWLKAWVPFWP